MINQKDIKDDSFDNFPSDYSYLYEYIIKPVTKNYKHFLFPLLNQRYNIQLSNNVNLSRASEVEEKLDGKEFDFSKNDNKSESTGLSDDFEKWFDTSKIQYREDYFDVISSLYNKILGEPKIEVFSQEKEKEIGTRIYNNKVLFITHDEMASCFKAFLGALFNCCGLQSVSKFLNMVGLTKYITSTFKSDWDNTNIFNDHSTLETIKDQFKNIPLGEIADSSAE